MGTSPSGLGGKMPHTLRDNEGVAADGDRDVMMPTGIGSTFKVIETQFAFHVLVHSLGPPPLFDDAHELLLAHGARQGRQRVLSRFALAVGPLDEKPQWLALIGLGPIVVCRLDAAERETRVQFATRRGHRAVAPTDAAERFAWQLASDVSGRLRIAHRTFAGIQAPHLLGRLD